MIYRLKSDPSVTVDAIQIANGITFTGPGPFPVGHQIASRGDWFVSDADGQRLLHPSEFEAYELNPETAPSSGANETIDAPKKTRKEKASE